MKRVFLSAEEMELILQALAIWEASADPEQDGDVTREDCERLSPLLPRIRKALQP